MENPRAILRQGLAPLAGSRGMYIGVGTFVLALLFGRVEVFSGLLPFGAALMAAVDMAGLGVYAPFVGACIGGALCLPGGLPALAGCGAYLLMRVCLQLVKKKVRRTDKLLLLTLAQLLLLPVFYMQTFPEFLKGMAGLALVLLLCIVFQNGLRAMAAFPARGKLHDEEQVAICLLFGALALSLSDVAVYAFSLGVVLICWAAMFMAYAKGLSAVAAGVALGGMLVLGGKGHPMLMADIAVCALVAAFCRKMGGAWGAAAGFLVCCGITEQYFGAPGQHIGLANAIPAALGLVALPKRSALWLRAAVDNPAKEERTARAMLRRLQLRASEDIQEAAQTVDRMAGLFPKEAHWAYDTSEELEEMRQAAYNVCADCAHRGSCWRDSEAALCAVAEMLPTYHAGMRPRSEPPLKTDCTRVTSIASAASTAQEAYRRRCSQLYRQEEQNAFAHRQLKGIGDAMQVLSGDLRERPWPDERFGAILRRRLEQEGIPVRGALVERNGEELRMELTIPPVGMAEAALEEAISRAAERRMRLLRTQKHKRQWTLYFEQAKNLKAVAGAATHAMKGSTQSGDSTGQASLPNGRALFALSDGMGSGREARAQSEEAIALLLKLYEIGFSRDAALESVNRLLMARGEEDMYATVDALYVRLDTGEAEFIKFGAPPSFVLRSGKVHTVYAEALPAGILDEALPAVNAATLRRNDAVVLLTDGALEALGEDAAEEILRCVGGANTCQDAAQGLLHAARERNEDDDMTVLVVRME